MATVSEQLRQARENQKLTIQQVAEITKIRTDHLRALEAGDFSVFSAPVYIRGFVRSYATLVKLNVPQIMAELDAELGQSRKFGESAPLTGPARGPLDFVMLQLSKVDWKKGLAVIAVVIVAGIVITIVVIWRRQRTTDPLKGLRPGFYQSTQHISGETLPLPAPKK